MVVKFFSWDRTIDFGNFFKNFTYLNQLVLSQTKHSKYFRYTNLKNVSQININNFVLSSVPIRNFRKEITKQRGSFLLNIVTQSSHITNKEKISDILFEILF